MTVCVFYVLSLSVWCRREIHVCNRNLVSNRHRHFENVNFVRQEGGNRVKEVIDNIIMIAHSALRVVVCVSMLGSIIVRCDKAFVLQYTCS